MHAGKRRAGAAQHWAHRATNTGTATASIGRAETGQRQKETHVGAVVVDPGGHGESEGAAARQGAAGPEAAVRTVRLPCGVDVVAAFQPRARCASVAA